MGSACAWAWRVALVLAGWMVGRFRRVVEEPFFIFDAKSFYNGMSTLGK
jgi:hypothetical protein